MTAEYRAMIARERAASKDSESRIKDAQFRLLRSIGHLATTHEPSPETLNIILYQITTAYGILIKDADEGRRQYVDGRVRMYEWLDK